MSARRVVRGARAVRPLVVAVLALATPAAAVPAQASVPVAPARGAWPVLRRDAALERALLVLAAKVRGDVGIYVRHLRTGRGVAIRADEAYPTASMVKVPIMLAIHDAIERGRLSYADTLVWRDSMKYQYEDDVFNHLRDSSRVALPIVQMMSITHSDNAASLWLQGLVGGAAINEWLAARGFDSTRVNSRTPGREAARTRYGWGQTTPREMAELLVRIREGRAVSPAADAVMYRILTRIFWHGEALSAIPPWVQAASKQGWVDRAKSEVVLVNAPSGDYVFCVTTKNQQDPRFNDRANEGAQLIREVSALLWRHFEPTHPWTPPTGSDRYVP
jgi:beta-lactamase class A